MPNKIKLPLPINGGINTQASTTHYALTQLRNARNAMYARDDQTLRRRDDIVGVGAASIPQPIMPINGVYFADTDKTFRKYVFAVEADVGFGLTGTLFEQNVESPGALVGIDTGSTGILGGNGSSGLRRPTQYNNILYWPSIPDSSGVAAPAVAYNGSGGIREAGIDIQPTVTNATFTINVAGAGALTFLTGRRYTYTLYDDVNLVESMPANNGTTLSTVFTNPIAAINPVVTVSWAFIGANNGNENNNHSHVNFYATTDGGVTYYFHSRVAITPDADTAPSTAVLTDSMSDATLITGALLDFNSPPPPALFFAKFQNRLVAGGAKSANSTIGTVDGEETLSNVLYYSLTDRPEEWPRNTVFRTSFNAIPFKDQDGEQLLGTIQVNRVLLVGLEASVWSINNLPTLDVDPIFDVNTVKDRITNTHGFVSAYCYESLRLSDDEDAAFYVSKVGFHLNNGEIDRLVSGSIRWDKTVYNSELLPKLHVINDTDNYIIIIGFASVDATAVDSAYVYHYHPSHVDENGVGKITGPWDYRLMHAALVQRESGIAEVWGLTNSATDDNIIVKLSGRSGTDYTGEDISFQWETGWMRLGDDACARLRELNITVEEADTAMLALGDSTLPQTVPVTRYLQLNSSGAPMKVLWDNDTITVKQITGSGSELSESGGVVAITSTDRAIVSASVDAEIYGEEKSMADGSMVIS